MSHYNTVFHQALDIFPRHQFQKVVNRHNGDYRVSRLRCWDQFVHLLYAQLSGRESMCDLVSGIRCFGSRLYHLGARVARRSTLSDANNSRSHEIYRDIFFSLSSRVSSLTLEYKLKLNRKLFILDSTFLEFYLSVFPWARFRKTKGAVKLHTLASIYKARWEIELFFKCIKQNLKIKRFFGTIPNTVFTLIWVAIIAHLFASFYKFILQSKHSIQQILRLVKVQLFKRRSLQEGFSNDVALPPKSCYINQLRFSILTGH